MLFVRYYFIKYCLAVPLYFCTFFVMLELMKLYEIIFFVYNRHDALSSYDSRPATDGLRLDQNAFKISSIS